LRRAIVAGGNKFCDLMKFLRSEEVSGSLFGCAEGRMPLGAAVGSGHQGAVSRAGCVDRSLRKLLLAINFRNDLPPKLVNYGSPERRHSAGAFKCFHGGT
jgi:hypothetical protein